MDSIIQNDHMDMESHLKSVNIMELIERIRCFRSLNFQTISDGELRNEILKVLTWENKFCLCINSRLHPSQFPLFRVRRLSGSKIPFDNFNTVSDLWEPPAKCLTKWGRLNKPHEPLLYLAQEPLTAIKESHIRDDEFYAIIQYKPKEDIKLACIGDVYDYPSHNIYDEHAVLAHEIYNNFLKDEFSRDVGIGTEYLYRISEMIAKDYFDFPPRTIQDAWAYSSVQDKNKFNICFRPEIAHELLVVHGVMICKKDSTDSINVVCVAVCDDNISFYPIGSAVQKELFPEIKVDSNVS